MKEADTTGEFHVYRMLSKDGVLLSSLVQGDPYPWSFSHPDVQVAVDRWREWAAHATSAVWPYPTLQSSRGQMMWNELSERE